MKIKVAAALEALKTDDFVYLHIEASDEAGHEGDIDLKLLTIENLDKRAVGPIYEAVKDWDEPVAIAVLPAILLPANFVRTLPILSRSLSGIRELSRTRCKLTTKYLPAMVVMVC